MSTGGRLWRHTTSPSASSVAPQDVPDDPQAVACGAVVDTAIPEMPRTLADPIRLSFASQRIAHAAPGLGEHSEEILREAGLSLEEVETLKVSGAIR